MEIIKRWDKSSCALLSNKFRRASCPVEKINNVEFASVYASLPSSKCSIIIRVDDIITPSTEFSIGLTVLNTFQSTSKPKFGNSPDSWGIYNRKDIAIVSTSTDPVARHRLLSSGDTIQYDVECDRMRCLLSVNNVFLYDFTLPDIHYSQYVFGCTLPEKAIVSILVGDGHDPEPLASNDNASIYSNNRTNHMLQNNTKDPNTRRYNRPSSASSYKSGTLSQSKMKKETKSTPPIIQEKIDWLNKVYLCPAPAFGIIESDDCSNMNEYYPKQEFSKYNARPRSASTTRSSSYKPNSSRPSSAKTHSSSPTRVISSWQEITPSNNTATYFTMYPKPSNTEDVVDWFARKGKDVDGLGFQSDVPIPLPVPVSILERNTVCNDAVNAKDSNKAHPVTNKANKRPQSASSHMRRNYSSFSGHLNKKTDILMKDSSVPASGMKSKLQSAISSGRTPGSRPITDKANVLASNDVLEQQYKLNRKGTAETEVADIFSRLHQTDRRLESVENIANPVSEKYDVNDDKPEADGIDDDNSDNDNDNNNDDDDKEEGYGGDDAAVDWFGKERTFIEDTKASLLGIKSNALQYDQPRSSRMYLRNESQKGNVKDEVGDDVSDFHCGFSDSALNSVAHQYHHEDFDEVSSIAIDDVNAITGNNNEEIVVNKVIKKKRRKRRQKTPGYMRALGSEHTRPSLFSKTMPESRANIVGINSNRIRQNSPPTLHINNKLGINRSRPGSPVGTSYRKKMVVITESPITEMNVSPVAKIEDGPVPIHWSLYDRLAPLDLLITVEHCSDCQTHASFSHNERRFTKEAESVLSDLATWIHRPSNFRPHARVFIARLPRRQRTSKMKVIKTTEDSSCPYRCGAFEVQVAYVHPKRGLLMECLHSKLTSGSWPNVAVAKNRLVAFLERSQVQSWQHPRSDLYPCTCMSTSASICRFGCRGLEVDDTHDRSVHQSKRLLRDMTYPDCLLYAENTSSPKSGKIYDADMGGSKFHVQLPLGEVKLCFDASAQFTGCKYRLKSLVNIMASECKMKPKMVSSVANRPITCKIICSHCNATYDLLCSQYINEKVIVWEEKAVAEDLLWLTQSHHDHERNDENDDAIAGDMRSPERHPYKCFDDDDDDDENRAKSIEFESEHVATYMKLSSHGRRLRPGRGMTDVSTDSASSLGDIRAVTDSLEILRMQLVARDSDSSFPIHVLTHDNSHSSLIAVKAKPDEMSLVSGTDFKVHNELTSRTSVDSNYSVLKSPSPMKGTDVAYEGNVILTSVVADSHVEVSLTTVDEAKEDNVDGNLLNENADGNDGVEDTDPNHADFYGNGDNSNDLPMLRQDEREESNTAIASQVQHSLGVSVEVLEQSSDLNDEKQVVGRRSRSRSIRGDCGPLQDSPLVASTENFIEVPQLCIPFASLENESNSPTSSIVNSITLDRENEHISPAITMKNTSTSKQHIDTPCNKQQNAPKLLSLGSTEHNPLTNEVELSALEPLQEGEDDDFSPVRRHFVTDTLQHQEIRDTCDQLSISSRRETNDNQDHHDHHNVNHYQAENQVTESDLYLGEPELFPVQVFDDELTSASHGNTASVRHSHGQSSWSYASLPKPTTIEELRKSFFAVEDLVIALAGSEPSHKLVHSIWTSDERSEEAFSCDTDELDSVI